MLIKIIIVLLLLFVLVNLFYALWLMVSGKPTAKPMSHYLGKRVLFSALVILVILLAAKLGYVEFHPNPYLKAHTQTQTNLTTPHRQNANTKLPLETQNAAYYQDDLLKS